MKERNTFCYVLVALALVVGLVFFVADRYGVIERCVHSIFSAPVPEEQVEEETPARKTYLVITEEQAKKMSKQGKVWMEPFCPRCEDSISITSKWPDTTWRICRDCGTKLLPILTLHCVCGENFNINPPRFCNVCGRPSSEAKFPAIPE